MPSQREKRAKDHGSLGDIRVNTADGGDPAKTGPFGTGQQDVYAAFPGRQTGYVPDGFDATGKVQSKGGAEDRDPGSGLPVRGPDPPDTQLDPPDQPDQPDQPDPGDTTTIIHIGGGGQSEQSKSNMLPLLLLLILFLIFFRNEGKDK